MATEILSRLDAFIRKYYLQKLIRGILLSVALLLGLFLLITFSEYVAFSRCGSEPGFSGGMSS